ncbi:MAG: DEAD/DEAH box helicase domain protein [Methanolobus sp. T82-4]|nr:MAG: DEAD/DEAH box helicase domain protein [Methanolobus sp. T82-4]
MENKTFRDLRISKETLSSIREMGYLEPTEVQSKVIPQILEGKDVIGHAKTGTGKTAAFGIPLAELIDQDKKVTQAMVLCPTRELANQVADELASISKHRKGLKIAAVYGGRSMGQQTQDLESGAQIVVGTPGRIMDHIERQSINMDGIKTMILDEADEMLKMGFRESIEEILELTPKKRQTLLFSATMPKPILRITDKYMQNPEHVKITGKEMTVPEVKQYYFEMKEHMKLEALHRLIEIENLQLALVFCNTIKQVDKLYIKLKSRGHTVGTLHGDKKQKKRENTVDDLRNENINIIIATDLAARGLDIDNIEAVVNYDLPQEIETYVHRIGRTARAGRPGTAYSFVTKDEIGKLTAIQRHTKTKILPRDIPSKKDVRNVKEEQIADTVRVSIRSGNLERYDEWVEGLAQEGHNYRDIAAALAKLLIREGK